MQLYRGLSEAVRSVGGHGHALLPAGGWGGEDCCSPGTVGAMTVGVMKVMDCPQHLSVALPPARRGPEPWSSLEVLEVGARRHARHQKGENSFGELDKI